LLLNVTAIAALVTAIFLDLDTESVGRLLAWSIPVAGVAQLLWVVFAARRLGFRPRFKMPRFTPGVKRLLWLAAPAAAAGGITQINLFIGQIIASTKEGAIAVLQYADRVYQLPLGVVGIAIGIVLLPELARSLKAGHLVEARHNQNRALEFALFLTLPAATALAIISFAVVRVLYERGAFSPETSAITSDVVAVFALGLPAFVMIKVFTPGYFAREDTRTPMVFAGISVAANIAIALSLFPVIHETGIATAESVSGWLNAGMLFFTLWRRGHFSLDETSLRHIPLLLLCCAIMAASLYAGLYVLGPYFEREAGLAHQAGALLLLMSGGALVYFTAAHLTGAADLVELVRNFRRQPAAEPPAPYAAPPRKKRRGLVSARPRRSGQRGSANRPGGTRCLRPRPRAAPAPDRCRGERDTTAPSHVLPIDR
jgi:putative peptidoglycan lipid II flippase